MFIVDKAYGVHVQHYHNHLLDILLCKAYELTATVSFTELSEVLYAITVKACAPVCTKVVG